MKARVRRLYYEEIEEILEHIYDEISRIESTEIQTDYHKDRKYALQQLSFHLEELVVYI